MSSSSGRNADPLSGSDGIRISSEPSAPAADVASVIDRIDTWNMATTGITDYRPVAIFLRDDGGGGGSAGSGRESGGSAGSGRESGAIRGGISGGIWGGWLHIVALWVDEDLRRRGYGRRLVELAEAEARAAGARHAFLETHSFQAPALYRSLGYEVFGELPDYPPGGSQLFLRTELGWGAHRAPTTQSVRPSGERFGRLDDRPPHDRGNA
jgi:GNAT superfamily N-acetyltransferase